MTGLAIAYASCIAAYADHASTKPVRSYALSIIIGAWRQPQDKYGTLA
jgi:hypothetical protein